MAESFYLSDGEGFVSTEHTRGPWSAAHQHGGPPSALLGRAIEGLPVDRPMHVARIVVELVKPVPIVRLRASARWARLGKRVRASEATLEADGTVVARAFALHVRSESIDVPPAAARWTPPPPPGTLPRFVFPFFSWDVGYHTAMDARVTGGEFGTGHLAAWMRPLVPLVPGEDMTPLQRVLTCVDSGNGLSVALPLAEYTFVNPDLTTYLFRAIDGEWLHLDARTRAGGLGLGMAECSLSDVRGPLGRSMQSLIIERRESPK